MQLHFAHHKRQALVGLLERRPVYVAKGDTAVLSAVLNQAIGSGSFTYRWQNSSDGKTWTDVPGNALQTLRVKTSDVTIDT